MEEKNQNQEQKRISTKEIVSKINRMQDQINSNTEFASKLMGNSVQEIQIKFYNSEIGDYIVNNMNSNCIPKIKELVSNELIDQAKRLQKMVDYHIKNTDEFKDIDI